MGEVGGSILLLAPDGLPSPLWGGNEGGGVEAFHNLDGAEAPTPPP